MAKSVNEYRITSISITFCRKYSTKFRVIRSAFNVHFINNKNCQINCRQNRKLRDSSNESDDDLDAGTSSPPPRSTIDGTKNVLPSKIKAVAVSNHIDIHFLLIEIQKCTILM